ncbi:hypothetical protein JYU20_00540 [Bacteroidales bacterium AH-315-I05]|nr:hypothetical protein [Bacteroidales bacterium AH-315-I05]
MNKIVITLIIALAVGVIAFWLGSTYGQNRTEKKLNANAGTADEGDEGSEGAE